MNYFVMDHHNFWQWPMGNVDSMLDADIVFMWADWPFKEQVDMLRMLGKKVIVYEHGFGALSDYYLNDRQPCADGYITVGRHGRELMWKVGVPKERTLNTGSYVFDGIKKENHDMGKRALYTALHWTRDLTDYNNDMFQKLREAYPEFEWTVKLNDKSGFNLDGCNVWKSDTTGNIISDVKSNIHNYDMVFSPRSSTFEMIARLAGLNVYDIDEQETYRQDGEPKRYPISRTYLKIGDRLPRQVPIKLQYEIKQNVLSIKEILDWVNGII